MRRCNHRISHCGCVSQNGLSTFRGYRRNNMSLSTSSAHVNTRGSHAPVDALLHGTWLLVARSVWAVVVVIDLVVFAAGLPALAAQLNIFCTAPARLSCVNLQLAPDQQGALRQAGLSLTEYAIGVF